MNDKSGHQTSTQNIIHKRNMDGIITSCTVPNTVALTFDDGPYYYTPQLLDYLDSWGVKATFFMNGDSVGKIEKFKDVVERVYNDGHQIASHTWGHADLSLLSLHEIAFQMTRLDTALKDIIGVRPVYMRPPYGSVNDVSLDYLNSKGYKIIKWTIDTNDWKHDGDATASMGPYEEALSSFDAHDRGFISLMHDTHPTTVAHLVPAAIQYAHDRGFKMVTVGECLGYPRSKWYRN
ncbi:nidulans chitin deacetylase [Gamsiella multidivaricata]|uniref:nidulans chitin deacetylase n=1 Tax=Gamsiella multidivaricata TaxID=101098 RepID=UPI00221FAD83|nr:nidulans chitin deacetylase [Gamsiella multidivaricata]KAI7824774.1 nidulans chitin deacetylase [Gamsiella multidivaricata]